MIETIIRDYIKTKITDIDVFLEVPASPPKYYILIEKTSSYPEEQLLWHSTFAVRCYKSSMLETAKLNNDIIKYFYDSVSLDQICDVEVNTTYNNTDTQEKKYCYQTVFDITHYE